jgi:hypothetical protein
MTVNVAAFEAALVRQGGPLFTQNDGTVAVTIAAAPVSNSRIDVIYVKQNESAAPMSDGADTAVILAVTGTAAASPVKPAIPTGALELATVLVPTGVTATTGGGVVITQTAPLTATAGGVVNLRNSTEQTAWSPGDGALAYRLDLGQMHQVYATVWRPIPFATASGVAAAAGGGGSASPVFWGDLVTVNFPAGRFTVPPVVTGQIEAPAGAVAIGVMIESVTATGFKFRALRVSSAPSASFLVHWQAVQMTAAAAAG